MGPTVVNVLLAIGAGICLTLQASANGSFRRNLNDPWYPAFFSVCGTIITAVTLMLLFRPTPPPAEVIRATPWWNWIGGPLGALIVLAGAVLTPRLGAGVFLSAMVGGMLISSMLLDHHGWMGLDVRAITPGRVVGAVLVVSGVACIKLL
jgi:transporter family-2 protein